MCVEPCVLMSGVEVVRVVKRKCVSMVVELELANHNSMCGCWCEVALNHTGEIRQAKSERSLYFCTGTGKSRKR